MTIERALKGNPWPDVRWTPRENPALVLDGTLHEIKKLASRVSGRIGYVVGVNEATLSHLCDLLTVEILQFYWMRVSDLEPLSRLGTLRQLAIRWNNELDDLSALANHRHLEALVLENTPRLRDLAPVSALRKLKRLEFSGGWWKPNIARTLAPIGDLPALEDLTLINLGVESDGLRPLARCRSLRRLEVFNQFRTEDYAYLSVKLPHTECRMFAPFFKLHTPIDGKDVMVVGSRKPVLNSMSDRDRLSRYEKAFQKLRTRFAEGD